jgi:levanase
VGESLPGQDIVVGATGKRFATSTNGGDGATGRITSPSFALDGSRLTLHVGGGTDATKLRVELWVDGQLAQSSGAPSLGGDVLREVAWDITALRGKFATLVLVDDSTASIDGHIDVDDVWIWN